MPHLVYKLQPREYNRYRKHLLSLDDESKYTRFGYAISEEMINKLCDKFEADFNNHRVFVIEDADLNVVAAGHIALEGETELAFSVLKEYRQQGMGSSLMKRCLEWCQNRNIHEGCMVCLSTNTAIKKLASKHGVLIRDGEETLANISIPSANPVSVFNEVLDSNLARVDHLGKLQRKFVKSLYNVN